MKMKKRRGWRAQRCPEEHILPNDPDDTLGLGTGDGITESEDLLPQRLTYSVLRET